jgi:hypothetical protein
MRATPITSALKRKYSPFKKEESTAQKESKKMLADETGVYVQKKITTPGTEGIEGTKGTPKKSLRQAYDDALALGYRTEDESFEDYAKRAKADPKYGTSGTEGTEGTEGTPDTTKTSEVKLKTKVEGTAQTPETYRRQVRSGKFAAGVEKRAAVDKARAEAKKKGLKGKEKRDYIKNARLTAKAIQKEKVGKLAGEVSTNVQKTAEGGQGVTGTYTKGERDTMQSEVDQSNLDVRTSGPGAAKKFFGSLPKDISSDIQMKFSPAKFKSYGKNSPMKKLSDLSGDGKITKKDVLIGRGVIGKDGSPAKYGNKKSPYKMGGYGNKTY